MGKNEKPCSTETVSHQVIEQQILTALDDRAKVALVIDESDLCLLIDALSWRMADLNASPRSPPVGVLAGLDETQTGGLWGARK